MTSIKKPTFIKELGRSLKCGWCGDRIMVFALLFAASVALAQAGSAGPPASAVLPGKIGASIPGVPGAIWADRNNDGYADGYVQNGAYFPGTPIASEAGGKSYLGVALQDLDQALSQALGHAQGELVRSVVPGGSAANAGVQSGDLIVAVNGQLVTPTTKVSMLIAPLPVGSGISIDVIRRGERQTLIGSTSRRPTEQEMAAQSSPANSPAGNPAIAVAAETNIAGINLATLDERTTQAFRLPAGTRGAVITDIATESDAYRLGLRRGDAIVAVGHVDTPDSSLARSTMNDAFEKSGVALLLVRRGAQPPTFLGLKGEASGRFAGVSVPPTVIQDNVTPPAKIAGSGPRHALVIGNGQYGASLGRLPNPANDARQVAAALQRVGFTVDLVIDADQKTMKRAISRFGDRLAAGGRSATGLFYYAGHGIQSRGTNYLIPVSAPIEREADLDLEGVAADTVLAQMEEAGAGTSIVILDACRNMPLARSFRSASRGLARMDAPNGSFIAYSTAPGSTAADGDGRNSPFAAALVKQLGQKGLPIEVMFRGIRRQVVEATGGQQTPWDSSSLLDPFYFVP